MSEHHKHIQLVGTVTLGPKGQVVIPANVRESMDVKPGDKLVVLYMPDKQSVGFVAESHVQELIDHMGENIQALRATLN